LLADLPSNSSKRKSLLNSVDALQIAMSKCQFNRHTLKAWLQRKGAPFLLDLIKNKLEELPYRGGFLDSDQAAVLVTIYLREDSKH